MLLLHRALLSRNIMKEFKYDLKLRREENACQYTRTYNNLQRNQKKVIRPRIEINQNIKKPQLMS